MIKIFLLIINISIFHKINCIDLPSNFNENGVNQIIESIIVESKNQKLEINAACVQQLEWLLENLKSSDDGMWALQMIDAIGKVSSGFLTNNVAWMGNYDECLSIEATKQDVKPRYCLAQMTDGGTEAKVDSLNDLQHVYKASDRLRYKANDSVETQNPLLPSIGVCIPHKCDIDDFKNVLHALGPTKTFAVTCQTKEDLNQPLDTGAILTIAYFGFFIVVMTVSTVYDICRDKSAKPHPLLIAFSTKTNWKRLFKISKNSGDFSCLNGLRFISMLWVIIGHVFSTLVMGPMMNVTEVVKYLKTTKSLIFVNGVYSVDTFFVVTGFLVVYSFMKAKHQGHKFNLIVFYLHRYLRLTPPLIPVVLSSIFLAKYLGSGPFYPQTVQCSNVCNKYWWSTLLYIENYVNVDNMCLSHTWYLNVDWQIYLISPVFLLFLPKKSFIGLALMFCATIGAMVSTFIVTWNDELPSLTSNLYRISAGFTEKYYMKTHTRAATWFIGAFLGYILAKIKFQSSLKELTLPKWLVGLNWIIVLTILPVCIFAGLDDLNNEEYQAYSNALYNTFARPAWALCVVWIIFACVHGYGGPINSILSLSIFQVLNRFTYSIYLLHLPIDYMIVFAQKEPAYFSLFNEAYSFWGLFALCFGLSIFWVLAFESPIPVLEKYLLATKSGSEKKEQIRHGTTNESTVSSNSNMA